jgi:hypothetical protein
LLSLEFEILFAAIRNAFLLTSKVNQIDEKNVATVFLTQVIGPSPNTKKIFFDLLVRFYSEILIEKDKFNMEETQTEQRKFDFKLRIDKFTLFFLNEGHKDTGA